MAEKLTTGKNALWEAYQNAAPLVHAEILLEIKKKGLRNYFYYTATKEGFDLFETKRFVRELFVRLLPETAVLFGLPPVKSTPAKSPKVAIPNQQTLFDQ